MGRLEEEERRVKGELGKVSERTDTSAVRMEGRRVSYTTALMELTTSITVFSVIVAVLLDCHFPIGGKDQGR